MLASAGEDTMVRLWNVVMRRQVAVLTGHNAPVQSVAFSPDGRVLASAGGETTVRLWSMATGNELARLRGRDSAVSRVAFSPDGTLAAAAEDGTMRLWNDILWRSVRELRTMVCGVLLAGLSRQEWALYAPGIPYRRTCP
jgi:WD40 repeat protein